MSVEAVPTPNKRTTLEVQSEFNNIAFRAGHLQRDIYLKERELKMINETLDNLYIEYSTLKQQEDAVAKAVADAAPKPEMPVPQGLSTGEPSKVKKIGKKEASNGGA